MFCSLTTTGFCKIEKNTTPRLIFRHLRIKKLNSDKHSRVSDRARAQPPHLANM